MKKWANNPYSVCIIVEQTIASNYDDIVVKDLGNGFSAIIATYTDETEELIQRKMEEIMGSSDYDVLYDTKEITQNIEKPLDFDSENPGPGILDINSDELS